MTVATTPGMPPSPAGVVRLVVVEMTSGAGLVAGVLLLAVAVISGLAMAPPETGPTWSNPFNLALTGRLAAAPLCGGAVAWLVRDYRRRGIGTLAASTNRGTIGGALPRVAAAGSWAVLAYLVMLVLFTLRSAHRGLPTDASLLLALLAGGFLVACVALGWAVGTLAAAPVAPPLLALAIFAVVCVVSTGEGWARRLAPVDPGSAYRPFEEPHVRLILVQVALLAGVTVLALSALVAGRRPRRLTGLAAALGLAIAMLALSRTDPAPTEIRGAPDDPACATGAVTVCLRPENAEFLAGSAQTLAVASAALAPYVSVPARFSEPGMDQRAAVGPGIFVPPARPGDPLALRAAALTAIVPPPCPPKAAASTAALSYADLLTWAEARVYGRSGLPPYALARVTPILGLDRGSQQAWVRHHLAATCAG